jgi:GrpB-like predicted nucleotidyltransferase (UPF0157 family)
VTARRPAGLPARPEPRILECCLEFKEAIPCRLRLPPTAAAGAPALDNAEPTAGKIEVVDYDPAWPGLFEAEARRIRGVLGPAVMGLEHMGSTAVPGLAAKPVIDIHLQLADPADEASYVPALEAEGYQLIIRQPEWLEHRMFKGRDPAANLHVFPAGCPEVDRCRLFRDWLRSHPNDLALYAATKRRMAAQEWAFVQDYANAKLGVISEIMGRAMASRSGTPPSPG